MDLSFLQYLIVPVAVAFAFRFLRKRNLVKNPQQVADKTWKNLYSIIWIIYLALFLGGMILIGVFLGPKVFFLLQKSTFGEGAIFFSSPGWAFNLINFFGTILWWGLLLWVILKHTVRVLGSTNFKQWLEEQDNIKISNKSIAKWIFFYYLIMSPFIFFDFRDYKAVYNDRIVANQFLDFSNKVYTLDQLSEVRVSPRILRANTDDPSIETDLYFYFTDSRVVDVDVHLPKISDRNQIKDLYKFLRDKGLKLTIIPPDENTIKIIQERYSIEWQEELFNNFDLNIPVKQPLENKL